MSHPSRYDLDCFVAGENENLASHVETCPKCKNYVEGIAADRDAMLQKKPPQLFSKQIFERIDENKSKISTRPLVLRWSAVGLAAMVVIALVAIFLSSTKENLPNRQDTLQDLTWMGDSVSVRIFAERQSEVVEVDPEAVLPGDKLRYQIKVPDGQTSYAALLAIENNEVISVLPSLEQTKPHKFETKTMLPGSAIIDKDTESLQLLLYVSQQPFEIEQLAKRVKTQISSGDFNELDGFVFRHLVGR